MENIFYKRNPGWELGKLKLEAGWIDANKAYCKRVGDSTRAIPPSGGSGSFQVKVSIDDLNIRTGAGTNYAVTGAETGKGTFTIVEPKCGTGFKTGWGRLKSGVGLILPDFRTWI